MLVDSLELQLSDKSIVCVCVCSGFFPLSAGEKLFLVLKPVKELAALYVSIDVQKVKMQVKTINKFL